MGAAVRAVPSNAAQRSAAAEAKRQQQKKQASISMPPSPWRREENGENSMIDWTLEDALPDAASIWCGQRVCALQIWQPGSAARSIEESYVRSEKGLGALG